MGISIGLVGLGSFGSEFAPLFVNHPLVDRVGFCDQVPERVKRFTEDSLYQQKFKAGDAYSSLEEILKSDLQAVVIMTQPWLHGPQVVRALTAGKHVYSAVPLTALPDPNETLEFCDRLVETCSRTGMLYMLGETGYYRPEAMCARRLAAEGFFGDIVSADGWYFHDYDWAACPLWKVKASREASPAGQEWIRLSEEYRNRGRLAYPFAYPTHSMIGPLSVMQAHMKKVSAWGWATKSSSSYFDDHHYSNQTALFSMSSGATMLIREYREIGALAAETFNIYGSRGAYANGRWIKEAKAGEASSSAAEQFNELLTREQQRDPLPAEYLDCLKGLEFEGAPYGGHGGSHAYLVNEFVSAVVQERIPAVSAWAAARMSAAASVAHQSALKDGECLEIPDWGDGPN